MKVLQVIVALTVVLLARAFVACVTVQKTTQRGATITQLTKEVVYDNESN